MGEGEGWTEEEGEGVEVAVQRACLSECFCVHVCTVHVWRNCQKNYYH